MPTSVKLAVTIGPAYILILGWVAWALFRRYRDNHYPPTLLLALVFCFLFGIAPFTLAALAVESLIANPHDTWLYRVLRLGAAESENLGVILIAVFSWRVFRPEKLWALCLVIMVIAIELAAKDLTLMMEEVGIWMPWQSRPAIALLYIAGLAPNYSWLIAESFSRWRKFRGRADLDPAVVRRFFLWGLAGIALLFGTLASPQLWASIFPSLAPALEPFFALGPAAMDRPDIPNLVAAIVVTRFSCLFAFSVLSFLCWAQSQLKGHHT